MLNERQLSMLDWSAGASLPEVTFPPLTRTTLALYAGGSGDHNPLHIDIDFARSVARMDDVIGHGMLTMALAAKYVTALASQRSLRTYSLRFLGMSRIGDRIACGGRVAQVLDQEGSRCAEIELTIARGNGELLASGSAVFTLDER
jgi:acyl dehydratase